jgi:hypothetical protein
MKLSEAASSHLAHRALAALKKDGAKVRSDRIALAQVKKTLSRHLEGDVSSGPRRLR